MFPNLRIPGVFPLFSQEMSYTQFSLNACKLGVCVCVFFGIRSSIWSDPTPITAPLLCLSHEMSYTLFSMLLLSDISDWLCFQVESRQHSYLLP